MHSWLGKALSEMAERDVETALEYFIQQVRLLLENGTMQALEMWAARFSELRRISEFDLCEQLAVAIRTADLPDHGLGVVRYGEGWLYDRMGRWEEAVAAYQASLAAFRQAGVALDAILLTQIGSIYQDQGDWQAAEDAYAQAVTASVDDQARGLLLNNIGNLAVRRGNLDAAQRHYDEARELLRDRDQRNFAAATHGLAAVLLDRGQLTESQKLQVECLEVFRSLGDAQGMGSAVGGIATAQLYAGHHREAAHNYEAALQCFMAVGDPSGIARTLANLALACQELTELDRALEYLTEAIAGYQEVDDRHGEASALVNLARLHHRRGDVPAARAARDAARTACVRGGYERELERLPAELQGPNS